MAENGVLADRARRAEAAAHHGVERRVIDVQALEEAERRGHRMTGYSMAVMKTRRATCRRCGRQIWVSTTERFAQPFGPALEDRCDGIPS